MGQKQDRRDGINHSINEQVKSRGATGTEIHTVHRQPHTSQCVQVVGSEATVMAWELQGYVSKFWQLLGALGALGGNCIMADRITGKSQCGIANGWSILHQLEAKAVLWLEISTTRMNCCSATNDKRRRSAVGTAEWTSWKCVGGDLDTRNPTASVFNRINVRHWTSAQCLARRNSSGVLSNPYTFGLSLKKIWFEYEHCVCHSIYLAWHDYHLLHIN